jgi:hypothetical protein
MSDTQLRQVLRAYIEAENLIAQLRAAHVDISDEEARQPYTIMAVLFRHEINIGEALATMNMVLKRLKAVAEREGGK